MRRGGHRRPYTRENNAKKIEVSERHWHPPASTIRSLEDLIERRPRENFAAVNHRPRREFLEKEYSLRIGNNPDPYRMAAIPSERKHLQA